MSFTLILILSMVLIAVLTIVLYLFVRTIFAWLENKLSGMLPKNLRQEQACITTSRKALVTVFTFLLIFVIGLEGLTSGLADTVLKPEFVVDEISKLDIKAVSTELWSKQTSDSSSNSVAGIFSDKLYAANSLELALAELGPGLIEQINSAVYSSYDYFFSETDELDVMVPLDEFQQSLKNHLREEITKAPPPELQQARPEQINQYAEDLYQRQFEAIPAELALSSETSSQTVLNNLNEARRIAPYLLLAPIISLASIFVVAALIIIVRKNLKLAFWELGIVLIAAGLVDFLYTFIAQQAGTRIGTISIVPSLNVWFIQVFADVLIAVRQPVIILCGVGIGFLILFFVLCRMRPGTKTAVEAT